MRRRLTESDMVVSMVKSGEDGPGFRVTYIVTTSGNTLLYSPTVYVGPSPTTSPRPTQGGVSVTPSNLTNMVSVRPFFWATREWTELIISIQSVHDTTDLGDEGMD